MDLNLEPLENLEAPLSDAFWAGFAIGLGIVGTGAAIVAVT